VERLHQPEFDNYIQNDQQELLLLEEAIDKNVDIHYQAYDELDYAKKNVIDCKLMEEGILVELLKRKRDR
jgi:hypothetical protein